MAYERFMPPKRGGKKRPTERDDAEFILRKVYPEWSDYKIKKSLKKIFS